MLFQHCRGECELDGRASLNVCRWQEVPIYGPRCDMAGQSMSLVPMLGASRMVSHTQARSTGNAGATFHLPVAGVL